VLRPPTITLLGSGYEEPSEKGGDEIRVVMQGTPKMRAAFAIGEFKKRIDMQSRKRIRVSTSALYRVVPGIMSRAH